YYARTHLSTLRFSLTRLPLGSNLVPYTTLFRSDRGEAVSVEGRSHPQRHPEFPRSKKPAVIRVDLLPNPDVPTTGYLLRGNSGRSEEHTSELESRFDLVCRLLLENEKTPLYILK